MSKLSLPRTRMPVCLSGCFVFIASIVLVVLFPVQESFCGSTGLSEPLYFSPECPIPGIEEIDRVLSGEDSLFLDSLRTVIRTRYAYSEGILQARRYLLHLIRDGLGYETSIQRFPLRLERPSFTAFAVSSSLDTIWLGEAGGRIYRLSSNGAAIELSEISSPGEQVFGLSYDPRGRLWAACGLLGGGLGALFVSVDGGESWNMEASGSNIYTLKSVAFADGTFGMACGSSGTVLGTANGGRDWFSLDPANFGYRSMMDVVAMGDGKFFLLGYFGDLYMTEDLGLTWENEHFSMCPLYSMDFMDEVHGVIVGSGVVYYSDDGGESWGEVQVDADLRSVCMVDTSMVFAGGSGGEIWMSMDGGASWQKLVGVCGSDEDILDMVAVDTLVWMCGEDVVRKLEVQGQTTSCTELSVADTTWGENISFEHRGEVAPDSVVVVCGHYDSISRTNPMLCAPGADDNGSGVISVLHTACRLRNVRLRRSVKFVLFDGEEVGLKGSRYFADHLDTERTYFCAVNIDMIGYNADGENTLTVVGREGNKEDSIVVEGLLQTVEELDLEIVCDPFPGAPYTSDHYSFWDAGIPAVLLIEGRKSDDNGWTPYYHSCNDTYDSVDFDFVRSCIDAVAGLVERLAGRVETPVGGSVSNPVIFGNTPNPFCTGTKVEYAVPVSSFVELSLYDVSGRRLCTLDSGFREGGRRYSIEWDGTAGGDKLPSGVYFLRLRAGRGDASWKMVILR